MEAVYDISTAQYNTKRTEQQIRSRQWQTFCRQPTETTHLLLFRNCKNGEEASAPHSITLQRPYSTETKGSAILTSIRNMQGAGSGRNDIEGQGHYDQRVNIIEAVRDNDDKCSLSRLHWVLFMTIMYFVFDIHSDQGMYFMTRAQYQ